MADEPSDDPGNRRQQLVTERTLELVDKQIGRGEPPTPEEWQGLRALAGGDVEAERLVDELQSVVRRFDEQLRARFGPTDPTVDLARLRQGLAHLVREIVRKKAAAAAGPPSDAN